MNNEVFYTVEELEAIKRDVEKYSIKVPDDFFFCSDDIKEFVEPNLIKYVPFLLWLLTREPKNKYEEDTRNYIAALIDSVTVKEQGECDTPPDAAEDAEEEITEKGGEPVDNDICGET